MIKIEDVEITGWEHAIFGMRNPMNSWDRIDSFSIPAVDCDDEDYDVVEKCGGFYPHIGENDHELMMKLAAGGPVHAKYRRMIVVYMDITAPLYWWKEFDTYKVGTVANSCSTMHKIAEKEFTLEDFSYENLISDWNSDYNLEAFLFDEKEDGRFWSPLNILEQTIRALNVNRNAYITTKDKRYWWQMIQLLPSSYNQRRTVMLNYEVLAGIYPMRKNHKLDEWREFCQWIEQLPYSEIIIGKEVVELYADGKKVAEL